MNNEYLLKPVIEIEDGDELKSFRMYYLLVAAFFFGLIPTMVLCIKNCIWLRVNRKMTVLISIIFIVLIIVKYAFLGFSYNANLDLIKKEASTNSKNSTQLVSSKSTASETPDKSRGRTAKTFWERLKGNVRMAERAASLLLLYLVYRLFRRNYKVVQNLTGRTQPVFKWAALSIVAAFIFEDLLSGLFFGGSL